MNRELEQWQEKTFGPAPKTHALHWVTLAGSAGHGEPLTEKDAEAWHKHMQEKYPDDLYWIEPVED